MFQVSDFLLFCILGFLACGRCRSRSSSSHSHCGNRCLAAGASGACGRVSLYNFSELRCVPRLLSALQLPTLSRSRRVTSGELGLRICALSITACSPRPRLGTLLSPGSFCHSGLEKTSFPLVMSSVLELLDVVHHLLVHVILLVPSRASDSSHSSFLAGFR